MLANGSRWTAVVPSAKAWHHDGSGSYGELTVTTVCPIVDVPSEYCNDPR